MNRFPVILSVAVVCAAGAVALLLNGCDTSPANQDLTIQPNSVQLSAGQDQEFTVSGGYQYTWSLESGGAGGFLSSRTGSHIIYSAPSSVTTGATQVILVTSTIKGASSGGTGTNGTSALSASGEAFVSFK